MQGLLNTVDGVLPAGHNLNPTSVASGATGRWVLRAGWAVHPDRRRRWHVTGVRHRDRHPRPGARPDGRQRGQRAAPLHRSGRVDHRGQHEWQRRHRLGDPHAVNVNLFGLADLQVAPTTASVALDRSTGTVTPSCNAGLVSYSTNGSLPTFVNITQLNALVSQILTPLGGSGSALSSALGALLTGIISYNPDGNLLTCDTSAPGTTASAKVGVLNLGLLTGLMGGVGLNVGDVSMPATRPSPPAVGAAATTATPAAAAPAATAAAAAPASVPGVTSVHTGKFWAGPLPTS